jgi:hypothetical protein
MRVHLEYRRAPWRRAEWLGCPCVHGVSREHGRGSDRDNPSTQDADGPLKRPDPDDHASLRA